ncbi:hypothetical protein SLA2020_148810 [Shorea laevis]
MDNIKWVMDIVTDVVPTVKKYVSYQIHHNDYVNEFKEMQTKLKRRRQDVEQELLTQLKQPRKIAKKEVEAWLKEADQETAEKVVEDVIYKGGPSTYIFSSRELDERTQSLKEGIFKEGEIYTSAGVSLVVDDHSIKGFPLPIEECRDRDNIQDQILEWLKGDKVTRIAVLGMGGVGKTTIMKQVHNQLLNEPKFNQVIWVKVSKDFDIIVQKKKKFDIFKFQKRIASSLELTLEPEDHENETKIAGLISGKLGQGSFVLILDDVWEPFSVEDVGILDLVGNKGCKLVLTTRLKDVARAMDCEVIPVNPLPPDEALALFLEKVGSAMLSDGRIKVDIKPFLEQILQKCGGVPLAIVIVAKSMRGKLLPRHWKLALSEFSKFESIIDCLKFSYESLEPQCQECFLYCALYPEDAEIDREELIEYWIEEGLIYKEGITREAMNWKGHDILDKLVDSCLLELTRDREFCVSMHDLLREMALEISPQFLVKAGIALEKLPEEGEWRENLLKVSLMENHITEIPSSMPPPKCPMLTTLLLSNNKISTIPEAFFEHMLGLKILDLSRNEKLHRLPSSISKLEKLTTLLLGDCESLIEVPSLSNLLGLKKLDFSWTSIEELPQGLNMLTNLKCLGLGGRLSETLDEQLQNLSKLQIIVVFNCKQLEEIIGSESVGGEKVTLPKLESLRLAKLPQLKTICSGSLICDSIKNIAIWECENIESVFWSGFNPLPNLEYLHLSELENLKSVFDEEGLGLSPLVPPTSFFSLKKIKLFACDQLKEVFSSGWLLHYFQSLETIEVEGCYEMEELISSSAHEEERVTLPKLQSLKLVDLPALKSICNHSSVLICDSIQSLGIGFCDELKRIPLNFPLLDNAQSSHPPSLKEILVSSQEWWESSEWDHPNAKDILFPFCKIRTIWL